jgi:hypothetical protein
LPVDGRYLAQDCEPRLVRSRIAALQLLTQELTKGVVALRLYAEPLWRVARRGLVRSWRSTPLYCSIAFWAFSWPSAGRAISEAMAAFSAPSFSAR